MRFNRYLNLDCDISFDNCAALRSIRILPPARPSIAFVLCMKNANPSDQKSRDVSPWRQIPSCSSGVLIKPRGQLLNTMDGKLYRDPMDLLAL